MGDDCHHRIVECVRAANLQIDASHDFLGVLVAIMAAILACWHAASQLAS
jgi:hypothetical protein